MTQAAVTFRWTRQHLLGLQELSAGKWHGHPLKWSLHAHYDHLPEVFMQGCDTLR